MENVRNLKINIDEQINGLNKSKLLFVDITLVKSNLFNKDYILSKIRTTRNAYFLYLGLSILLGIILYIAGFIQVFSGRDLLNLSRAGLMVILTFGNIAQAWRLRIDMERLKQIAFLLDVRSKIDSHSI